MARILVVDDEPDIRFLVARRLKKRGHQVLTADDGLEALDLLSRESIDLVLSDVTMPRLDGLNLLNTIRTRHPEHALLPIVLMSGMSDRSDIVAGRRLGADDYVLKPLDFDQLDEAVEARLARAATSAGRHRQRLLAFNQIRAGATGTGPTGGPLAVCFVGALDGGALQTAKQMDGAGARVGRYEALEPFLTRLAEDPPDVLCLTGPVSGLPEAMVVRMVRAASDEEMPIILLTKRGQDAPEAARAMFDEVISF